MRITLQKLIESTQSLAKLFNQPLPAKAAFVLSRIQTQIDAELKSYEQARIGLCEKYGTKNEEKNEYEFNGNKEAFNKEFEDLISAEVTLTFTPIKLDTLTEAYLTASDMSLLDWIFADE